MRGMGEKQVYIYGITDEHGTVRYVGKSVDVSRRFSDHLKETQRTYPLYTWLRKQQREGCQVGCVVLASATGPDWQSLERAVIAQYRQDGYALLNLAEGGDEPYVTLEQRRALGARIVCPPEVRRSNGRKVSAAIQADPVKARLHKLKKLMCLEWKRGNLTERVKDRLVQAAFNNPQTLWCFAKMAAKHG
jgi:hypothetical protein